MNTDDEEYGVSDSEDDYTKEDKLLLENARSSMKKTEGSSDEEVYGFEDSENDDDEDEEEEEEKENDIDMGSDIEDESKPPDERAWGKKKRSFYSTDFVDQDYEGVYEGDEAEEAELEEQEARNIQKRLVEQLNEADFSIEEAVDIADTTEATSKKEVIESDLSKLTKRQKLDLLKKESPEFFALVGDFKEKMLEAQKLLPVIELFKSKVQKSFPALDFLQTKLTLILNYCTNISYYLYLKAKKVPVKNHPILKSLFRYRQLLHEMEDVDEKIMKPQLHEVMEMIKSGKEIELDEKLVEKKTLKVLKTKTELRKKKELEKPEVKIDEDDMEESLVEEQEKPNEKRAITYEMAKNKGLIPKRSKEQRNPRVKHRRKYEKAKIRRRGQVRMPRREIPVYGGEPTGIKIGLTKSIKLKY